jgi:protein-tyrosine phosphatase
VESGSERPPMVRVLFVCLGNICRSPMAEAVFAHKVREAGLEDAIEADSAGTGHWHVGEPPHSGTRRILAREGIAYAGRARLIAPADFDRFDYIVAMDRQNRRDIEAMGSGRARVVLFMDYAPHLGVAEVPDPYYDGRFDAVYDLVQEAAEGLLAAIRREHGL